MKNFAFALKSERKFFVLDYKRSTVFFVALLCILCAIGALAYDACSVNDVSYGDSENYESEIAELEKYFDVYEGKAEADTVYDFSEGVLSGNRDRLELLRHFVKTGTNSGDYINLSLQELPETIVSHSGKDTKGSVFALNAAFVCGAVILVYSFVTGALRGASAFGAQRKTALLCDAGRKELFLSGITWDAALASALYLLIIAVAFIGIACSPGRWFYCSGESGLTIGSCFELVAGRLLAYFVASVAVYFVGLMSGLFKYRKTAIFFALVLIAALFAVGIYVAVKGDMRTDELRLIPVAGLMFNTIGYRDPFLYANVAMTAFIAAVSALAASTVALRCDCR